MPAGDVEEKATIGIVRTDDTRMCRASRLCVTAPEWSIASTLAELAANAGP